MKQFDVDSFLIGLCFALLIVFLIYFIVKSVKQDRYIKFLEGTLEHIQEHILGIDKENENGKNK